MRAFVRRLRDSAYYSADISSFTLTSVAWISLFGFPLYYWFWTHVFPQAYENIWLRLFFSAGFFVPWLLKPDCSGPVPSWFVYWWHLMILSLFSWVHFMTLKNDLSSVWMLAETMVFSLFMSFYFDWLLALVAIVTSLAVAISAYVITNGFPLPFSENHLRFIPMVGFAFVGSVVFQHRLHIGMLERDRRKATAMSDAGAHLAHELATPLSSIEDTANILRRDLPRMARASQAAMDAGVTGERLDPRQAEKVDVLLSRVGGQVRRCQTLVEMMLMRSRDLDGRAMAANPRWMSEVINDALPLFPWKNPQHAEFVHLDMESDFLITVDAAMIHHVLFNLLKNSLHFVGNRKYPPGKSAHIQVRLRAAALGDGRCRRSSSARDGCNVLIFRDNGPGISKRDLPFVTRRFYSTIETGTGLGLAFVAEVMERASGFMEIKSALDDFTEVRLYFPAVPAFAPEHL